MNEQVCSSEKQEVTDSASILLLRGGLLLFTSNALYIPHYCSVCSFAIC